RAAQARRPPRPRPGRDPRRASLAWATPRLLARSAMAESLRDEEGEPHPRFRPLHELPRALRPQEKLAARGVRALAHRDLLALALGTSLVHDASLRAAERLLARHGLRGLAEL